MSWISKLKQGFSKKANAALDAATDPRHEVEALIAELEAGRKQAIAELISYKATAKTMEADLQKLAQEAAGWHGRAEAAVRAGDDELAKQALREVARCTAERQKREADRAEAAGYAASLNRSRKEFESKLAMLKLRKGTLATQLAMARGKQDALSTTGDAWEKFAEMEARIDAATIEAEVDAAMRGEALDELPATVAPKALPPSKKG